MTNFEKIKAMGLEEVAEFMYGAADKICFENCAKETGNKFSCERAGEIKPEMCINCMKHWLKSEVGG